MVACNPELLLEACRTLDQDARGQTRELERVGSYPTEMMEVVACLSPEVAEAALVRVEALEWNKMPE
jgi:hypothetical protein